MYHFVKKDFRFLSIDFLPIVAFFLFFSLFFSLIPFIAKQTILVPAYATGYGQCSANGQYTCTDTCPSANISYTDPYPLPPGANNACSGIAQAQKKTIYCCMPSNPQNCTVARTYLECTNSQSYCTHIVGGTNHTVNVTQYNNCPNHPYDCQDLNKPCGLATPTNSPPNNTTYSCKNNQCVQDPNGTFSDNSCGGQCSPPNTGGTHHACVSGKCQVVNGSGSDNCSACSGAGSGGGTSYNCGPSGAGKCYLDTATCPAGTTSIYKDAGACQSQLGNGFQCCNPNSSGGGNPGSGGNQCENCSGSCSLNGQFCENFKGCNGTTQIVDVYKCINSTWTHQYTQNGGACANKCVGGGSTCASLGGVCQSSCAAGNTLGHASDCTGSNVCCKGSWVCTNSATQTCTIQAGSGGYASQSSCQANCVGSSGGNGTLGNSCSLSVNGVYANGTCESSQQSGQICAQGYSGTCSSPLMCCPATCGSGGVCITNSSCSQAGGIPVSGSCNSGICCGSNKNGGVGTPCSLSVNGVYANGTCESSQQSGQICQSGVSGSCSSSLMCCPATCGSGGICITNSSCSQVGAVPVSGSCNSGICCGPATSHPAVSTATVSFSPAAYNQNSHPENTLTYQLQVTPHVQLSSLLFASNVLGAQVIIINGTATYNPSTGQYLDTNLFVGAIPAGQYDIILHVDGFLDKRLTPSNGANAFTIVSLLNILSPTALPVSLIPGDIAPPPHGDNFIDIQDYNLLVSCYNKPPTGSCKLADFNGDGTIGDDDLAILQEYFGLLGDSFNAPQFTCVTDPSCNQSSKTVQLCPLKCTKQ